MRGRGRRPLLLALTLLPRRWLEASRRRGPIAALLAPLAWWLRRGSVRVDGGAGSGLRLSLAQLPLSHAHAGLLPRGQLEPPVQEALRRLLGPGRVLYDIGANLGFFTLVGARLCAPGGAVVAFEPVPESAAAVRENAALNGLDNVTVLEVAAGEASGPALLTLPADTSWARLSEAEGTLEVEVVAVDELVLAGRLPAPDVVKIDVEGGELAVLRGMRRTIADHSPTLVCELHGGARDFMALMDELGYAVENLEGPAPVSDASGEVRVLARRLAGARAGGAGPAPTASR